MIGLEKATTGDAKALALVSKHAFEDDINYDAPEVGGPPGYKSGLWQSKMMRVGMYYKVLSDNRIVGGCIVFDKGNEHYELGRIFIDPAFQNQGIGAQVMTLMEQVFPDARRWTLGTPRWNKRNHRFYAKMGYVQVGVDGPDGILFEKQIPKA